MESIVHKDKKFMDAVNKWVNPDGDCSFKIIAEKAQVRVEDGMVSSAIVLVLVKEEYNNGNHHAEVLRLWTDFNGEFALSCEMQHDCSEYDESILVDMFKAMAKFIPVANF